MVLALMGRLRIIQPCEKRQTPQKQHYWQMETAAELKRRGKAPRRHKYLRASRARIDTVERGLSSAVTSFAMWVCFGTQK